MTGFKKDLIVLVADDDIRHAVNVLLSDRNKSLGIRPVSFDIMNCPNRDSGCFHESEKLLGHLFAQYSYAMVMFDREGCGKEDFEAPDIQMDVQGKLDSKGWRGRSAVIVFDPEFDIWFWNDSPHTAQVLGWRDGLDSLKQWLVEQGYLSVDAVKPERPKEAMRAVLKHVRKSPSASLFQSAAGKVTLKKCTDPSFSRFRSILREWFPASAID